MIRNSSRFNLISAAMAIVAAALLAMPPARAGDPPPEADDQDRYHVRLMRIQFQEGSRGSALFMPEANVIPLSAQEIWGSSDQIASLRGALGATEIEPIPGLVIGAGPAGRSEPHRFRTALGNTLVDLAVLAEPLPGGWHRVQVTADDEMGGEILDASLLVKPTGTVAVVAPLLDGSEALILGVTPMARRSPDLEGIHDLETEQVTMPRLIPESRVQPTYPPEAKKSLRSGKVILEAVIRKDGVPDRIVVLKMPEGGERLAGNAVEAVSQWRYEPALLDGKPVDVFFHIVINYQLK